LSAALALAKRGIAEPRAEQAAEFKEVGAGIQLGGRNAGARASAGVERCAKKVAVFPKPGHVKFDQPSAVVSIHSAAS